MKYKIAVVPGDGIGPEVVAQGVKVLKAIGQRFGHKFDLSYGLIGAAALDEQGTALPPETVEMCQKSASVLVGSVGHPRYANAPLQQRPERGLLELRYQLGLVADLRFTKAYPALVNATRFKPEVVRGVDICTIRDLMNRLITARERQEWCEEGGKRAGDPLVCYEEEARRILKVAFDVAQGRRKTLASVCQYQALASSKLWQEVSQEVSQDYPDVSWKIMAPDAVAMQLVLNPRDFDVIVTDNPLMGGMYDDLSATLGGGAGMSPSAELNVSGGNVFGSFGLHESIHGSAPKYTGLDKVNPIATIRAVYTMLTYTLTLPEEARAIDGAIANVVENYRTYDIMEPGKTLVGTQRMGDLIAEAIIVGENKGGSHD